MTTSPVHVVNRKRSIPGVLGAFGRVRRAARGRWTSQCARQARRFAGPRQRRLQRRGGRPDEPCLGRDGAEERPAAHITLVAVARGDGFEIFAHSRRVAKERIVA